MNRLKEKWRKRERRHGRVRRRVFGTPERPRLTVYRSLTNIYAQIIDDIAGHTLAAVSSLSPDIKKDVAYGGNRKVAAVVGQKLAEKAKVIGIKEVTFDRGGYKFHGRIKALADSARKHGLKF
ncbi:MAG: 50S ribosomal protein L18 [Planctomycetes bacterium]|nr:50S ribosomal protein L18 [Planctomycetota bacterium]MBM4078471.1 50S ribosomal protein L18 [Planctomycetota bacterium]MBM4083185.1 50S ribosomal protein L18 [Planctomycetota bacterium]